MFADEQSIPSNHLTRGANAIDVGRTAAWRHSFGANERIECRVHVTGRCRYTLKYKGRTRVVARQLGATALGQTSTSTFASMS
eukprot:6178002-Pleurochrysis_carterae.AAC.3